MDRVRDWVAKNFQENVISDSEQKYFIVQTPAKSETDFSEAKVLQDNLVTDGDASIASSADTIICSSNLSITSTKTVTYTELQSDQINSTSSNQ